MSENMQLISLSKQIALQRQMDVVANNMANMTTNGYKGENLLFEQYLMPPARDRAFEYADQPLIFTQDWATMHDMRPGTVVQTGNPFDVAIEGEGFLVVDTPDGERFSRAGNLGVNTEGIMTDVNGNPVLSDAGPVQFDSTDTDVHINPDGLITTSNGPKARLRLVEFRDAQVLSREGDNLYAANGAAPTPAVTSQLRQGSIERSNVSGITEMGKMVRISRAYQSLASLIERQSEMRTNAIRRLGDMSA